MSYAGTTVEIPVGQAGLVGTKNQAQICPDQLIIARNVAYDSGTLKKEGGAAKYNSVAITGTPTVIGGWDWWPVASTQRMIVVTGAGNVLKDDGSGTFATTLASGLTVTNVVPIFVEGGKEAAAGDRKLFLFTGSNAVKVLAADGATMTNLATPPVDWSGSNQPVFGVIHEGKLWGGGNANDPHRIYYSTTANQEDFTGSGSGTLSIFPGEGEKLVGAVSFKGILICWKYPTGIYVVDTSSPQTANWRVTRVAGSIGGVSPAGHVLIDNDILFLDAAGNFQLISSVTEFGDMANNNLSQTVYFNTFMRDNIDLSKLSLCRAIYYPLRREAHFALHGTGATKNNRRVVWDFNEPQLPRVRFSDRDVNHTIWLRKDTDNITKPYIGEDGGFVYKIDQATKSKDGAGYVSKFQTAHMDLSHMDRAIGAKRKLGQFLELLIEPTGNYNLTVDIYWDNKLVQTLTFNMSSAVGDVIRTRRKRILGSGRHLSIAGTLSGADQDFSIIRAYLGFMVADEAEKRT